MKSNTLKGAVLLSLLVIASVASLLLIRSHGEGSSEAGSASTSAAAVRKHSLADASRANFLSIFVYDAGGGVASYMVGGGTDEFGSFSTGITDAKPVPASADASFSDLLVFSFGPNDTLELPYSESRNLFTIDDQAYSPTVNLTPQIAAVEGRLR